MRRRGISALAGGRLGWAAWAALAGLGYYFVWRPRPLKTLPAHPAQTYEEAMARVAALQAEDHAGIKSLCRTQALIHGHRTNTAILLLHGYSSSPHQYHILGPQFFERGHNVLIPRYPYHGEISRTPVDFWRMSLETVLETVSESLDIVQGLGERVIVLGLSFGGALAAWLAQFRADIDRAVIASPALGFRSIRGWRRQPAQCAARFARPRFTWWDAERKEQGGVYHAYAGWNTRGAAEMMRLGLLLAGQARQHPPRARSITVVLNPADRLLDLRPIFDLASAWQRHYGGEEKAPVDLHLFPEAWGLRHDLIEPDAENAQIERAYPVLIELAEREGSRSNRVEMATG